MYILFMNYILLLPCGIATIRCCNVNLHQIQKDQQQKYTSDILQLVIYLLSEIKVYIANTWYLNETYR